jgi:hypothetical protein
MASSARRAATRAPAPELQQGAVVRTALKLERGHRVLRALAASAEALRELAEAGARARRLAARAVPRVRVEAQEPRVVVDRRRVAWAVRAGAPVSRAVALGSAAAAALPEAAQQAALPAVRKQRGRAAAPVAAIRCN